MRLRHRQHAQHLLAGRVHRAGADHRPDRRGGGKDPYAFRRAFVEGRPRTRPCSTRRRRPATGAARCRGHRAGHRGPQRVQGLRAPAWWRSTAGRRRSTGRSRTPTPGPRVTKVVFAVDVGLMLNPTGLEAQMLGGIMDGIAQALTSSLHLKNGTSSRAAGTTTSTPGSGTCRRTIQVIIMPTTSTQPRRGRRVRRRRVDGRGRLRLRAGHRHDADRVPDQPRPAPLALRRRSRPCPPIAAEPDRRPDARLLT